MVYEADKVNENSLDGFSNNVVFSDRFLMTGRALWRSALLLFIHDGCISFVNCLLLHCGLSAQENSIGSLSDTSTDDLVIVKQLEIPDYVKVGLPMTS